MIKKWKPERNERYWSISPLCGITPWNWSGSHEDEKAFQGNNCFRTIEEAQMKLGMHCMDCENFGVYKDDLTSEICKIGKLLYEQGYENKIGVYRMYGYDIPCRFFKIKTED